MEKFSHFTDKSSGISPFKSSYTALGYGAVLSAVVLFPVKLVLLLLITLLWSPLLVVGVAAAPFASLVLRLFSVGVDVRGSSSGNDNAGLVLVNATGPLDWFLFQMLSGRMLVMVPDRGHLKRVPGFFAYYQWCISGSLAVPAAWPDLSIEQAHKAASHNGTVWLLAEGTITNNRGILPLANELCQCIDSFKQAGITVRALTVKLNMGNVGTVVPVSGIWWLWVNLGRVGGVTQRVKFTKVESCSSASFRDAMSGGWLKILGDSLDVQWKRDFVSALAQSKK
ncbi:hypothetical protein DAMA08_046700 [Martiniozyma asiatica (nom. inval.)]|nr:hypothetical protein DAMA08_046700 [Martiniozyma asiatica]